MHREFQPQDMHQLDADPFVAASSEHTDHAARRLYSFTAVLGLLIGGDVILSMVGLSEWRLPTGISLSLIAAVLGAVYIVYGALEALLHGRIGADFALAQACIAALVLGQPFVAAEVVFIALAGEVLEAVTFARTERAVRSLVAQTPRTARVRRDGVEVEIAARDVAVGELVIVRPGERTPVDGPVAAGRSTVDQSALTGESIPVDKGPCDRVFTGTLNQFGAIEVHAEKVGGETTFGQVVRMVAQARGRGRRDAKARATAGVARPGHAHSRHQISGRSSSACRGRCRPRRFPGRERPSATGQRGGRLPRGEAGRRRGPGHGHRELRPGRPRSLTRTRRQPG